MSTTRESFASIWARRTASIPSYLLLLVVAVATVPVWVPLAIVSDIASGDPARLPRTRAGVFFLWYLLCEAAGVVAAAAVWGIRPGGAKRFVDANAALQRVWSEALFRGALRIFNVRVSVTGAESALPAPFLLFVRHSSAADTVLAAHVVANPHRILLKYVLKRELLWDPCLDIVGRRLPNAFVSRTRGRTGEDVAAIADLGRHLDEHTGVLIYPEGTRFTPSKLASAMRRLREQGNDVLTAVASRYERVLPPRLGGALALLDAAPGTDVIFLDHEGFEGAATFRDFWSGQLIGRTLRVRLRRVRAADIPREHRDRWLFEQWLETDRWVRGDAATELAA